MTARICVLDYGMGNLRSVEKALEHVGATATIANDAETIRAADGLILPGVGAFPKAMLGVRSLGLDELIEERRTAGVPILGICLGLQLLFDSTHRAGRGGWPRSAARHGGRRSTPPGLKVPHIGWSPVRWERESRLTEGIESRDPLLPGPLLRAAARAPATCSAPPPTAPASPARPSATTSSASSSTPRSRAPPACGCSPTSPGSAPPCRRDPLPGDRHPRRQGGAPAAGRLRARDGVRRRPGRRGAALGRAKAPSSCMWSTSTGPRPASRGTLSASAGSPPRSSARSRSAVGCATPTRSTAVLDAGAERVVIGTAALRDPAFLAAALEAHGERVVVSVDARDGKVALAGWLEVGDVNVVEAVADLGERGVSRFLCTAIEVDGTMEGPALDELDSHRRGDRGPGDRLRRRRQPLRPGSLGRHRRPRT